MLHLEIVYLSPKDIQPYDRNARVHSRADIDAIKKSIIEVGFNDPIGIYGENNIIVEGHGRRMAAIELGMESVPCIRLDNMTDSQRRLYTIAHNRIAELSAWDVTVLQGEIEKLASDAELDMQCFKLDDLSCGGFGKNFDMTLSFREYSDNMKTKYFCLDCGYEWN